MYFVYTFLLTAGIVIALPYWIAQMIAHGKYRRGIGERWGAVPARLAAQQDRPTVWVHAVSVGEVLAVSSVIDELKKSNDRLRIVISTTTDTGQNLACDRFGPESVFYFPLDFPFAIRPCLQLLKPELVVLAETEFWPNFLRMAKASGARVAVVNARISRKSLRGYSLFQPFLRYVLKNIDLFLAQSEEDAHRLKQIGALPERVQVRGNLKYDVTAIKELKLTAELRISLSRTDASPVIVCGSTVDGEEPILIEAFEFLLKHYPSAVMLIAPRHPERFAEVTSLVQQSHLPFDLRSQWTGQQLAGHILVIDSIGELSSLYSLADIAFVGGSLVPRGGHNILEPAQHGVPILVGPHTDNFREMVHLFRSRDALRVVDAEDLGNVLVELCSNPTERALLGRRAAETLRSQSGVTDRTLTALLSLLSKETLDRGTLLSENGAEPVTLSARHN